MNRPMNCPYCHGPRTEIDYGESLVGLFLQSLGKQGDENLVMELMEEDIER